MIAVKYSLTCPYFYSGPSGNPSGNLPEASGMQVLSYLVTGSSCASGYGPKNVLLRRWLHDWLRMLLGSITEAPATGILRRHFCLRPSLQ